MKSVLCCVCSQMYVKWSPNADCLQSEILDLYRISVETGCSFNNLRNLKILVSIRTRSNQSSQLSVTLGVRFSRQPEFILKANFRRCIQTWAWCKSGEGVIPPQGAVSYTTLLHQNYLVIEKPDILFQDTENQSSDHIFFRKISKKHENYAFLIPSTLFFWCRRNINLL